MTWLNPLALAGLFALAVPILVHLFGRRVAKRQRFPSLRLLLDASPTPSTRSQPSDLLLLVVRCAILAIAAFALAQPRWSRQDGRGSTMLARVVIVDTSYSMQRLTSTGETALMRAREMARALVDSSREGLIIETAHPGFDVSGAASWLEQRAGRRELVIVSDFQSSALSEGTLAAVPRGIGIRLSRIPGESLPPFADSSRSVAVALTPSETEATWHTVTSDSGRSSLTVLAPDDALARTSIAAARQVAPEPARHPVAVVFPGYAGAADVASRIGPFRSGWQGDFLLALRSQDLLRVTMNSAPLRPCAERGAVPLPNASGQIVATVAAGAEGSPFQLVVFSCVDAGTAAGTALLAAVSLAASPAGELEELEPVVLPDEILRHWERPLTEVSPRGREDTSPDGRWFWLLALMLLFVEEWLRRRSPRHVMKPVIERRERVA